MNPFEFKHEDGSWFSFRFRGRYAGNVKIFQEGSKHGMGGGRISKLTCTDHNKGKLIFSYDRGLDFDAMPIGILSRVMEFLIEEHDKWIAKQKEKR